MTEPGPETIWAVQVFASRNLAFLTIDELTARRWADNWRKENDGCDAYVVDLPLETDLGWL